MSFAIHDMRLDAKQLRGLVALCLPKSQQMIQLVLSCNEDDSLNLRLDSIKQSVRAVAAVKAARQQIFDLLVLRSDHSLFVTTFEGADIDIVIDNHISSTIRTPTDVSTHSNPDIPLSLGSRPRIVALRDCVVYSVSLELEDGTLLRMSANLTPTDPLVQSMMVVLASSLRHDRFVKIWKHFLCLWNGKRYTSLASVQFDCLAEAILAKWGMGWISTEKPLEETTASRHAWSDMLQSNQHFRLQDDSIISLITPPAPAPPPLPIYRELSKSEQNSLHVLLVALHILGEELRLIHCDHESLLRLSTLTARLAQIIRPGFFDLLKRSYPSSSSGWRTGMVPSQFLALSFTYSQAWIRRQKTRLCYPWTSCRLYIPDLLNRKARIQALRQHFRGQCYPTHSGDWTLILS